MITAVFLTAALLAPAQESTNGTGLPDVAPGVPTEPSSASNGPEVALAIQPPTGLSDAEAASTQKKLEEELAGLGVTVVAANSVEPACVPDPSCVENARVSAGGAPDALLVVEMLRIGPVVQLTAT